MKPKLLHLSSGTTCVRTFLTDEQFDLIIYALTELAGRKLEHAHAWEPGSAGRGELLAKQRRIEALLAQLVP